MSSIQHQNNHELAEIWSGQIVPTRKNPEEIMAIVKERSKKFEKTIRYRNWREIIASAIVIPVFAFFALHSHNLLEQIGYWIIVASAVWIIYYLRVHQASSISPNPELDIQSYVKEVLREYDRQIELLKKVKYWYLLPLYTGLMLSYAGYLQHKIQRGTLSPMDFLCLVALTALYVLIWWLNEVMAVKRIRSEREKIKALVSGKDDIT